jgi:hypothetical protein
MLDFDWYAVLATTPVAWAQQGDEWMTRFGLAVINTSSGIAVTGYTHDATTGPFVQVRFARAGSELDTCVLLAGTPEAVVVLAAGPIEPEAELLSLLAAAAQEASARLGEMGSEHDWTAIIGHGTERTGGTEKRLAASATVGPLRIESTEVTLTEPDTSQNISLSGWSIHRSVPILVNGTSRGYSWQVAAIDAARQLRTLCGLLSVSWESDFAVREAAASLEWGTRQVPVHPPWYAPLPPEESGDVPGNPVTIPDWLDEAWDRLDHDPHLLASLDAFLEGIYAERRHPSLAAVSFTACVETIAKNVYNLDHCSCCGATSGIGRAFRASLRLVLDENEAAALDPVYGDRSKTVHAGRFHGGETTPGFFFPSIWREDPARDFRWGTLLRLRKAARLLLERALTANLPPKGPLQSPTD